MNVAVYHKKIWIYLEYCTNILFVLYNGPSMVSGNYLPMSFSYGSSFNVPSWWRIFRRTCWSLGYSTVQICNARKEKLHFFFIKPILLSLLFIFTKWGNYLNHLNNNDDLDHFMASWKTLIRTSHNHKLYQTWSRPDQYSVNMAKGSEESNQAKSIKIVWELTRRRLRQFLFWASYKHNISGITE